MRPPVVSIVMPVHNGATYLYQAIKSVQTQEYDDWELLIVNDQSTDQTSEILADASASDQRITVLNTVRKSGAAAARNLAIRQARGRFITFLDADDEWLPSKLRKQVNEMESHGAHLSYTAYRKIDECGKETGFVEVPRHVTYERLLGGNVIGCSTAMYDTRHLGKQFMPDLPLRQDHGLWLKVLKKLESSGSPNSDYVLGINEPLVRYRIHAQGQSRNKWRAIYYQWRLYRKIERLPFGTSVWAFVRYAVRGYLKQLI